MSVSVFDELHLSIIGIFLGYSLLQMSEYMVTILSLATQKIKNISTERTLQGSELETGNNKLTFLDGGGE